MNEKQDWKKERFRNIVPQNVDDRMKCVQILRHKRQGEQVKRQKETEKDRNRIK